MTGKSVDKIHILVVDDELVVQTLVRDALEEEGYQVSIASGGNEALDILNQSKINLLITDMRMPGIDGIELASRAKEIIPDIGTIFITGYANLNSAKDAIKQGALDYIMKPFELHEIRQAVEKAVQQLKNKTQTDQDSQLNSLSDLNSMLFAAGDRQSLVTASLKFTMLHLHCKQAAVLYFDMDQNQYSMLSIDDENTDEQFLGKDPLYEMAESGSLTEFRDPEIINSLNDHPLYIHDNNPELLKFLTPAWYEDNSQMIVVPVTWSASFYGLMMFAVGESNQQTRTSQMKFLSIASGQLAITLENLSLLKETQDAYASLKELQDQTIQLERMAARGEVSAEIAHELNNFMGVIAGNIGLLEIHLEKKNYEKLDKYIATVSQTLEKIKVFTNGLMDVRPLSTDKKTLHLNLILSEVVEYLNIQKRFQNVTLRLQQNMNDLPFRGDELQIQQLLYNLLNNAADATRDCPVREVDILIDDSEMSKSFSLTIRDSGVGFNKETLVKAFQERFTTKSDGHGLGLVVCRRIIDNHGAKLSIKSKACERTSITITFPKITEDSSSTNTQPILEVETV